MIIFNDYHLNNQKIREFKDFFQRCYKKSLIINLDIKLFKELLLYLEKKKVFPIIIL